MKLTALYNCTRDSDTSDIKSTVCPPITLNVTLNVTVTVSVTVTLSVTVSLTVTVSSEM